jgi:hypothetical protein
MTKVSEKQKQKRKIKLAVDGQKMPMENCIKNLTVKKDVSQK